MCIQSSRRELFAILMAVTFGAVSHWSAAAIAQEAQTKAVAVSEAGLYKPTLMPDRIVLTLNGDPRTTRAVSWRTSTEVARGIAEIAEADATPYFSEKSKPIQGTTQELKTNLNTANFHTVVFNDLVPGKKYAYRVGDGTNWSEWFHFEVTSAKDEPFSFIYFGDAQNGIRSLWSRVIREAYSDAPKAVFLLHAGDLVNNAESDAEWGEWCGSGAWINAMMPNVAVPGNHEQAKNEDGTRRLSHHWRPQFEFPLNGPKGLEEVCFSFVYHNVLVVGLDSNRDLKVQAEWLDKLLSENTTQWVVCSFHHPIFSTAKDRDNPELRAMWKPIFDKYKVDLVLQGHDHSYGRTGLKVPSSLEDEPNVPTKSATSSTDQPRSEAVVKTVAATVAKTIDNVSTGVQQFDGETGTIYVVSVSGPKMYNNQRHGFMKRLAEDQQLYQVISVDGGKLRFEARTAVGDLYDAFELQKQPGKINELIEIAPEVPQHLRPAAK